MRARLVVGWLVLLLVWTAPAASALGQIPLEDKGRSDGKIEVPADLKAKRAQNKAGETTTAMRLAAAKAQAAKGKTTPVLTTAGIDSELAKEPEKADAKAEMEVGKAEFDRKVKGLAAKGAGGAKRAIADYLTLPSVDAAGCTQIVCEQPDFYATPNYANSPLRMADAIVTIGAPDVAGGTQATAVAEVNLQTGMITGFTVTEPGTGYTAAPTVTIASVGSGTIAGTGAGAAAVTTITAVTDPGTGVVTPGGVSAVTLAPDNSGGTGYVTKGLRKFVDGLPGLGSGGANNLGQYIPVGVPDTTSFPGSDYYEIALVQYTEQLHSDLPATLLRGYVQLSTAVVPGGHLPLTTPGGGPITLPGGAQAFAVDKPSYLGPFIQATKDKPVRILFRNLLPTGEAGNLFLPVDTTVMGAGPGPNMDMAMPHNDQMPMCADSPKPSTCFSENRATLHLHGGITPWISDGTPHQWITPAGESTDYPKGVSVSNVPDMPDPGPGAQTFFYTNQQSARLMFYHDHAWGITRLNVYAGEAAGYSITDPVEQALITDGLLPGAADTLPLIVQDKTFVPDTAQLAVTDPQWSTTSWGGYGQLWTPHVYMPNQSQDSTGANPFGRWAYGWWFHPQTSDVRVPPIANAHFDPNCDPDLTYCQPSLAPGVPWVSMGMEAFNDTAMVNGTAYPTVTVDPKSYRVRLLNASNDRFFNFSLYQADTSAGALPGQGYTEVALNQAEVAAAKDDPTVFPTPDLSKSPAGPSWTMLASEGGWLPAPAVIPAQPTTWVTDPARFDAGNVDKHSLLLAPAERADTIVDFSAYAGKTLILYNDAPAAFPARDSRQDYYTDNADLTSVGGAPTTPRGYGPNTRTIMQIKVAAKPPTPYGAARTAALNAAFAHQADGSGVFESGQHPIVVGQKAYNAAYGTTFDTGPLGTSPNERLDGLVRMTDTQFDFQTLAKDAAARDGQVRLRSFPLQPKAIHDEMSASYDVEYGRMSGNLGLEGPNKTAVGQQLMLYPYVNPPDYYGTPAAEAKYPFNGMTQYTPLATLDDGTQIWKITHNGVDTHPIHFHLFDIQLVNRVGWDNIIRKPEPSELGWKDTVRVSPLEDTIVALRPVLPKIPWGVPDSKRPLDPSMPLHTTAQFNQVGADGNQVTTPITNEEFNFRWEYVWHCHILSHEEMDMMRPYAVKAPNLVPDAPTSPAWWVDAGGIQVRWVDPTPVSPGVNDPGSGWGVWSAEYQFRLQYSLAADQSTWTDAGTALANAASATLPTGTITAASQGDYVFRIVARNAEGDSPSVAAAPALPPSIPAGLVASALPVAPADATASVQLTWSPSAPDPATGYAVQRATDAAFTLGVTDVGTSIDPTVTLTDSGLPFGTTVYYRVRGTSIGASVSGWSEPVGVTTGLSAPTGVLASSSSPPIPPSGVSIGWTAVTGASGYEVARVTGAAFDAADPSLTTVATLAGGSTVTASDASAVAATTYSYAVRATAGTSPLTAASAWSPATYVTWPQAPTGLALSTAAPEPGSTTAAVTATWTIPVDGASTFELQRTLDATGASGWTTVVSSPDAAASSLTDPGAPLGVTATYRVLAVNAAGAAASGPASILTGFVAPTGVTATASAGPPASVTVTWIDTPGGPFTYEVGRSVGPVFDPDTAIVAPAEGSMTHLDAKASANTIYSYAVRAVLGTLRSAWSTAAPTTTIPDAPIGLAVLAGATPDALTVSWSAPSAPQVNAITGYIVERSSDGGLTWTALAPTPAATTTLSDTGLPFATSFSYRVAALTAVPQQSDWTETATSTTTGLPTPTNVVAMSSTSHPAAVSATWDPVAGATAYEVEVQVNGGTFAPLGTVTTTSVSVPTPSVDTTYVLQVRATAVGSQSAWSASNAVTTIPAPPTAITATAGAPGVIDLGWVPSLTGGVTYTIERSTDPAFTPAATTVVASGLGASTLSDTGLLFVPTYFYRVTAVNAHGTSEAATTAVGATTNAGAPSFVTATPSTLDPATVTVTWAAVQGATGYDIERAPAGSSTFTSVGTWTAGALSFTDASVSVDSVYVYQVRSSAGALVSTWTMSGQVATIPAAPTNLHTLNVPGSTATTLVWTAPSSQTVPVTGYLVQRATDAAFTSPVDLGTVSGTNYADNPPSGATTYYYRVATLNVTGRSAFSAGLEATSALLAPTSVTATASTSAPASVTVVWAPVAGATGYEIVRSDGTVFTSGALTWTTSAAGSATTVTDPTAAANTAYTYAVRGTASVSGVALVSSYTAAAAVVTIPSAPALLPVGQGSQDSLVVSWTAPAGQLSPITGYVLERSLTGTDGWTTLPTTGLLTSLTDTGLAFLTTYHYRVATVTAVGQSAWSAIQSATTGLAAPATATAAASTTAAEVTVTWTAVPTVTAYEVARSDGASFVPPGSSLTATSAGLTFVDPTVVHGSTYTYAVRALMGATPSGWSTTNSVTAIPAAPSGLAVTTTATSLDATANLVWSADVAASSYVVQRASDAAFTTPVAVTAIDQATASDTGLAFVTTYYYRVAGVNATGQSAWSPPVSATTPLGQPSAFTATDTTSSPVSVSLGWLGNASTSSYEVRRSTGASFDEASSTVIYAGLDTATTDSGAAAGAVYTYAVRGLSAGGAVQSAWTTVGATTLPDAPTGVTAIAGSGSVSVSWIASQASSVTYTVERSTAVDFSANVVEVGTGVSGTSVIDLVSDIATHYYRVKASNGEGVSAWSVTAAASTALTPPASLSTSVSTAWPLVVTLTWPAVPGATGYEVQRSTSTGFTTTTTVPTVGSSTSTTDTTAAPSATYYYRVRATATAGTSVSGWTTAPTVTVTPSTAIVRVTGLVLRMAPVGASPTVNATWTSQAWAGTYTVQFATNSAFTLGLVTQSVTSAATSYAGLTVGVRYYVRVRAEQPGVLTTWSSSGSIVVSPPPRPATLVATLAAAVPGSADVTLTWTPKTTAPIGGYILQRATDSLFVTATTIATPSPGATTYLDAGLARNVRYYWRIVAVNSAGQSTTWRTVKYRTPA